MNKNPGPAAERPRLLLPGPFGGHPGSVFALAYSADGRRLASGGWDGTIRLWDPDSGEQVTVLHGHAGAVRALTFQADGEIVSVGRDRTIRRWSADDGSAVRGTLLSSPSAAAFSADGRGLVVLNHDRTVEVWDAFHGIMITQERGRAPAHAAALLPDGSALAVASFDDTIRLGPVRRDAGAQPVGPAIADIRVLTSSPDGSRLAVGRADGRVHIVDLATGDPAKPLQGRGGEVTCLAFSRDGDHLAVGSLDGDVSVWRSGRNSTAAMEYAGHLGQVCAVDFAPDGSAVASAGIDGAIRIWPLASDGRPRVLAGHVGEILSVAYRPDGSMIATGDIDGVVRIWETQRGALVDAVSGAPDWVRSVAFSGDGTLLAAAVGETFHVWEATADDTFGRQIMAEKGQKDACVVTFTAEGPLACVDADGFAQIRDVRLGRVLDTISPLRRPGASGSDSRQPFSHDSAWSFRSDLRTASNPTRDILVRGLSGGDLEIEHTAPGAVGPRYLQAHQGAINVVVCSPQDTYFASGGDDGAIHFWSVPDFSPVRTLTGHAGAVRDLAFAPDGHTLISVGDDGRILEWHAATGQPTRGSGLRTQTMPQIPGLRSDNPSAVDLLGMSEDVCTLAALIAASGTRPPLAIALLGEWGSGKSSVMLQVERTVADLAAQSRLHSGYSLFAGNVRQVRFNAWHYSDDQVWTGLVDHLFRTLAADPHDPSQADAPEPGTVKSAKARIGKRLAAKQADLDLLDRRVTEARRLAAFRAAAWQDKWALLFGAVGALASLAVRMFGVALFGGRLFGGRLAAALRGPADAAQSGWERGRSTWERADALPGRLARYLDNAVDRTEREVAGLEDQLARIDTAANLALLLKRHAASDAYGGYRGLVGQVHHDLEQLDAALAKLRAQHRRGGAGSGAGDRMPLERIVLYIDDLDRCPPARVMDVLAAVHLMLALPLFVVVVAVDPRWLIRALREHYGEMLSDTHDAQAEAGEPVGSPLDYLDKIFQIPFAVRKPQASAMGDFLLTLLSEGIAEGSAPDADPPTPRGASAEAARIRPRASGSAAQQAASTQPDIEAAAGAPDSRTNGSGDASEGGSNTAVGDRRRPADSAERQWTGRGPEAPSGPGVGAASRIRDLRPGGLILRREEAGFMSRLGPLLPTARTAKKLANLYRLVRIGVADADLPAFIESGGYQPVQILLAVLVSAPSVVPGVFAAIQAAGPDADLVALVRHARTPDPQACARIADLLARLRRDVPDLVLDPAAFRDWCPQLARYSFHTLALADELGGAGPTAD